MLYGYEEVERDLETYSKPILLVGESGKGKRTWAESHIPENSFVVRTTSRKAGLTQVGELIRNQAAFTWVLHIDYANNIPLLQHLLKSVTSKVIVLAYTESLTLAKSFEDVASIHYIPYLTDEQMHAVCAQQGLKQDEADFAVKASFGIPGNITRAFEMLRSRKFILEFLENVRDNNHRAITLMVSRAEHKDLELLESILVSFETGRWTLFTESEVEPLRRIQGLLRACLRANQIVHVPTTFSAIATAALYAYHGRV